MLARTKLTLLAALLACALLVWLTFPAALYAYYWFIYPIYYYPFRHRMQVEQFTMRREPLPSSFVNDQRFQRPVWLLFDENPSFGIVVDGIGTVLGTSNGGVVPVLLSIHGDRRKGAMGFTVQSVGSAAYGAHRPALSYSRCAATPAGCGPNPLDRVICQGPCRETD